MSPDQIYCKIVEYEISWPREDTETKRNFDELDKDELVKLYSEGNKKSKFQISVIGMKVVLFKNKYERVQKRNWFYSMYDEENDEIIGTQWIPDSEMISKDNEREGVFYQL